MAPTPWRPDSDLMEPQIAEGSWLQRVGESLNGKLLAGRYRIVSIIGGGGMASVHLARVDGAGGFQKWVAIKRIHSHLVQDDQVVRMFMDEARIAASISHSNVAQVFDVGTDDDAHWLAMEYLHGDPVRELIRYHMEAGRLLDAALAARIIADAAEGLHAAHELRGSNGELLGLVHRDVSPHNLFLTYDGVAKVVDFGIAKVAHRLSETRAGTLKGKIAYMAPEQALGHPVDRRSDVFSLGIVLWELLAAKRLFREESDIGTLEKVQRCEVPQPSLVAAGIPREIDAIVMRALQKDPRDRFQTAREFSRALNQFLVTAGKLVGSEEIAQYLESVFAERIAERNQYLNRAAQQEANVGGQGFPMPASSSSYRRLKHQDGAFLPEKAINRVSERRVVQSAADEEAPTRLDNIAPGVLLHQLSRTGSAPENAPENTVLKPSNSNQPADSPSPARPGDASSDTSSSAADPKQSPGVRPSAAQARGAAGGAAPWLAGPGAVGRAGSLPRGPAPFLPSRSAPPAPMARSAAAAGAVVQRPQRPQRTTAIGGSGPRGGTVQRPGVPSPAATRTLSPAAAGPRPMRPGSIAQRQRPSVPPQTAPAAPVARHVGASVPAHARTQLGFLAAPVAPSVVPMGDEQSLTASALIEDLVPGDMVAQVDSENGIDETDVQSVGPDYDDESDDEGDSPTSVFNPQQVNAAFAALEAGRGTPGTSGMPQAADQPSATGYQAPPPAAGMPAQAAAPSYAGAAAPQAFRQDYFPPGTDPATVAAKRQQLAAGMGPFA